MQSALPTWQLLQSSLDRHLPSILMYVLESSGSSPGRQGFLMAVNAAGEMSGSLGGGIMEYKFVEMARARLREEDNASSVHRQIHDKSATQDRSGMICSGEQTIFLYRVRESDRTAINALVDSLLGFGNGTLELSPDGVRFNADMPEQHFFLEKTANDFLLREKTGLRNRLHVIGGGHCSLAFSRLMAGMDFHISVYDERPGLHTMNLNRHAHQRITVGDYAELGRLIDSSPDNFVVVMTFGYRTDDVAVRALLHKKFRYFGLLGSRKKIEQMFVGYRNEGLPAEALERIYAPVGLPINSRTPEEIAVSIAAQIILVKNSR